MGAFKFEIIGQYQSKGALRYIEANLQHKLDVLLDPNYYNKRIDDCYAPSPKDIPDLKKGILK